MTETMPVSPVAPAADEILSQAAQSAAQAAQPATRFRLVPADLPSLLACLAEFAAPASRHLEGAFQVAIKAGAEKPAAVREVPHYDTIREWVAAHPDEAARVVQVAVYLASGRFVAQEEASPPAEASEPSQEANPTA